MSYVRFNEQNISIQWTATEQEGDGWYQVPEEHEGFNFYKLENNQVLPLAQVEEKEYKRNVFKGAFQISIKAAVSSILTETDWLVQRHSEQVYTNGETSLTDIEYEELIQYRSDLRALSNQDSYPEEYVIPEFPLKSRYSFKFVEDLESLLQSIPQEFLP